MDQFIRLELYCLQIVKLILRQEIQGFAFETGGWFHGKDFWLEGYCISTDFDSK